MFERIITGWELAKQSLAVLRSDKELLLFPLISGITLAFVSASFLVPLMVSESGRQLFQTEAASQDPFVYFIIFAFYFINYFIIIFFNAALVGCTIIRFHGGNPTFRDGFRTSMECLPKIFAWALVSATVGMILKIIESRSEKVGKFVSAILGMAWNITTYFVLPILVVEKVGPVDAFKRSTSILKKNWGEALTANIGIGLIVFCLGIFALVPSFLGFIIGTTASILIGTVITVICMILVALTSTAASTIITVALYEHAENRSPEQFDQNLLEQAFVTTNR